MNFTFDDEIFKNTFFTRYSNTSIYGMKLNVKEFDEYTFLGKKKVRSVDKHVHYRTYWSCKKRRNLNKKRVLPEEIAQYYAYYRDMYNSITTGDPCEYFTSENRSFWKAYFTNLKVAVKDWNTHLFEDKQIHQDNFDRNKVPNVSFNDFPPTHIILDKEIYQLKYEGIQTILYNKDGHYHNVKIHIEDIPIKYRYRADNILFVPNFIRLNLS